MLRAAATRFARPPAVTSGQAALCRRTFCRSVASDQTGPDATRGYDVVEYAGLWQQLNERQWPQQTTVAVVGPIGDTFAAAAVACAHDVVGPHATTMTSESRSRWQSVRLRVLATSADDVCELHSRLRALEGAKAVL